MLHVTGAEYLNDYRVLLEFNDGFSGVADLNGRLTGPIFQPLSEIAAFREFKIDGHTLCWSNGADFAPEYLREIAAEHPAEAIARRKNLKPAEHADEPEPPQRSRVP